MPRYAHMAWFGLPVLAGVALGQSTVAAMQISSAPYASVPAEGPQDRYTLGQNWAARHHPEDANACPAIDILFQSGCIAATRY
jgi:hypothetical protein